MLTFISEKIIGPVLPVFLVTAGLYMNICLGFFPFTKVNFIIGSLFHKRHSKGVTPLKALCVALAGTLGVGNIAGVAVAIHTGGPGALFWMWISAVFSMILKYGETVLALKHQKEVYFVQPPSKIKNSDNCRAHKLVGGAMYFIKSKPVATLFALLCIASSFTVGNLLQANAVGESFRDVFGISEQITGILLAAITFFVIFRGTDRITAFCSVTVPLLSIGYIIMSLTVIIKNFPLLPYVFHTILKSAFSLQSLQGGFLGSTLFISLKTGFAKGLITNEAGCGTAPIAHASAFNVSPVNQGFLGIIEVFFDTIILCTMTGLVILLSIEKYPSLTGITLVNKAFSETFGNAAGILLSVAVFFFVLATLVGWSFYGRSALEYFTQNRRIGAVYCLLFSITALIGSIGAADMIWTLSDITCGLMTFISTGSILVYSRDIKKETDAFFISNKSNVKRKRR